MHFFNGLCSVWDAKSTDSGKTGHNTLILFYNYASSLFTQLTMPRFEVKQSAKLTLTSYSGLALIGQCCQAAQVEAVIDPKLPVSQGMKTSDLVKVMVGLLAPSKSDLDLERLPSGKFNTSAASPTSGHPRSMKRKRLRSARKAFHANDAILHLASFAGRKKANCPSKEL